MNPLPAETAPSKTALSRTLRALAARHGVQLAYQDVSGVRRQASTETLLAVLGQLGVELRHPEDAVEALAEVDDERGRRVLDPVVTCRPGGRAPFTLRLPRSLEPDAVWVDVDLEDGGARHYRMNGLIAGPPRAEDLGTIRYPLRFPAPAVESSSSPTAQNRPTLPFGYHRVSVHGGTPLAGSALLIAAPDRCPALGRGWGVTAPVYALRRALQGEGRALDAKTGSAPGGSAGVDWGVGSYRDLGTLADWVGQLGGEIVGTLPLNAGFLGQGGPTEPCPYLPASRLAFNELFVDVENVAEVAQTWPRHDGHGQPDGAGSGREHERKVVDYTAAMAAKRAVLEVAANVLFASGSRRRQALETFAERHPEIVAYAWYRASLEGGTEQAFQYHLYGQWLADTQLASVARRHRLLLDLPIGVHPSGFDPRWEPEVFVRGSGGAPPDDFYAGGQVWGFPPLHPEKIRQTGYRYVIACLRHAMAHAAALRIDHAMGLERLFWVPDGLSARDGAYVRYHADELYAIYVLEAHRAGVALVGEDLGTVPSSVRRGMHRSGMLRSYVFQFESTPANPLPEAPRQSMASLGTHDLPRFAVYFEGLADDHRRAILEATATTGPTATTGTAVAGTAITTAASTVAASMVTVTAVPGAPAAGAEHPDATQRALWGCLEHLAQGPAQLVLIDLEDLWLEREPQNRPGTGSEAGNWCRRTARVLDDVVIDPALQGELEEIDNLRRRSPEATSDKPTPAGPEKPTPVMAEKTEGAPDQRRVLEPTRTGEDKES